jgi:hypothetical protein
MIDVSYNDDDIVLFDMAMEVTMNQVANVYDVTAVLEDAFSNSCQTVFSDAEFNRIPHVLFDLTTIIPTIKQEQENNGLNTPRIYDAVITTLSISQTQSLFDTITTTTTTTTTTTIKHSNKCNRK